MKKVYKQQTARKHPSPKRTLATKRAEKALQRRLCRNARHRPVLNMAGACTSINASVLPDIPALASVACASMVGGLALSAAFFTLVFAGLTFHLHIKAYNPDDPNDPDDESIKKTALDLQEKAERHHIHLSLEKAIQLVKERLETLRSPSRG